MYVIDIAYALNTNNTAKALSFHVPFKFTEIVSTSNKTNSLSYFICNMLIIANRIPKLDNNLSNFKFSFIKNLPGVPSDPEYLDIIYFDVRQLLSNNKLNKLSFTLGISTI